MEVPSLGIESELQPSVYTTARATLDPSHVCCLHHSSLQWWILNPLSEARDRTWVFMDTSQVCNLLSHSGNALFFLLILLFSLLPYLKDTIQHFCFWDFFFPIQYCLLRIPPGQFTEVHLIHFISNIQLFVPRYLP